MLGGVDADEQTSDSCDPPCQGHFTHGSPPPITDPLGVARHGSADDKWVLAGYEDLDDEVLDLLLHSGDTNIASSLGMNGSVPARVLGQLAELHPEHTHWIGINPAAPVHLKDAVPIGDHTSYALMRYLEQRGASAGVRRAIYQRYQESPKPGGPLLGDVWRDVAAAHEVDQRPT